MPGECAGCVGARAVKRGSGAGAVKSSPEVRGFGAREREETTDPVLVCGAVPEVLPPCDLLRLCMRWAATEGPEGLGEKGSWAAIRCELDGNECGVAMLQFKDRESGEEYTG